jgi:hypothetical protein
MSLQLICGAIRGQNLIQFHYAAGADPGPRLVEPHMVAYNEAENLALSGWFLGGNSESQTGQGWREYLLESISGVTVLPQRFLYTRPGYNPSGGKKFRNVQCAV